jgi:hypothetical protein
VQFNEKFILWHCWEFNWEFHTAWSRLGIGQIYVWGLSLFRVFESSKKINWNGCNIYIMMQSTSCFFDSTLYNMHLLCMSNFLYTVRVCVDMQPLQSPLCKIVIFCIWYSEREPWVSCTKKKPKLITKTKCTRTRGRCTNTGSHSPPQKKKKIEHKTKCGYSG